MEEAIPKYLVPYRYYVHIVRLDDNEQADYQEVAVAISKACAEGATLSEEDAAENIRLGPLLRRRHEIIGGAKNKVEQLRQILRDPSWRWAGVAWRNADSNARERLSCVADRQPMPRLTRSPRKRKWRKWGRVSTFDIRTG
jgi:hypothetical protein